MIKIPRVGITLSRANDKDWSLVNVSFLQELLNTVAEQSRALLPKSLFGAGDEENVEALARALMKAIEDENRRLKRMYADLSMQADLLKEALGKK